MPVDHLDLGFAAGVGAIFFASAFVAGIAGFAFAAISSPVFWLLPPTQGVVLIMAISLCNQLTMVMALKEDMRWWARDGECAALYLIGGIAGAPLGLAILTYAKPSIFAGLLGAFLRSYGLANLAGLTTLRLRNYGAPGAIGVGAIGGLIGGFSGFPGSAPVIYLSMRDVGKQVIRGVTQPYILAMQCVSLTLIFWRGRIHLAREDAVLFLICLPLALVGTAMGMVVYRRLSNVNFRRAVFVLLAVSGAGLLGKAIVG